jgi:hypothetical protein
VEHHEVRAAALDAHMEGRPKAGFTLSHWRRHRDHARDRRGPGAPRS